MADRCNIREALQKAAPHRHEAVDVDIAADSYPLTIQWEDALHAKVQFVISTSIISISIKVGEV